MGVCFFCNACLDDYWTLPKKLKKQRHSLCLTKGLLIYYVMKKAILYLYYTIYNIGESYANYNSFLSSFFVTFIFTSNILSLFNCVTILYKGRIRAQPIYVIVLFVLLLYINNIFFSNVNNLQINKSFYSNKKQFFYKFTTILYIVISLYVFYKTGYLVREL